jgi:polyhydroxyalkanoate synthase
VRRLVGDVSRLRLPATVDTSKFEVGVNLAATPGSVILRTEVFELIQYRPQTEQVRRLPLLFVPPTINKSYVLDLAPGRSLIEYLVGRGQQVFMISWRNPEQAQGYFDLDTYADAVAEARETVASISGEDTVHVAAACSGGIITAGLLGHLADTGRLAGVFTWLRPNDLVWSYVVNNYLLGKDPPAFDVLYWNQDTVRLAAGLHRDLIRVALENPLTRPGALNVLDSPVDLSNVETNVYVLSGLSDHIVPWENAYRSARLFGGARRFVLSRSGHIQALVNPPSPDSRSSFRVAEELPEEAEAFLAQARTSPGSWWPDWGHWLAERSGELEPAQATLGNRSYKALAKAPGTYVFAR